MANVEELLAYFVKHGRAVYFVLPALGTPLMFSLILMETAAPWNDALLFAAVFSFTLPAAAFCVHLVARGVFLTRYRNAMHTVWPSLGFQACLFTCSTAFGCLAFFAVLSWAGSGRLSAIALTRTVFLPVPLIGLIAFFYFSGKYYREQMNEARDLASAAETNALRAQMQPHFLFNSLHTLSELIETNREEAINMVHDLGDLFRYILASGNRSTSSLASEISVVQKYLALQKRRLGDRLRYSVSVPEGFSQTELPPLLLQTLVENAVRHGIAPSATGGEVRVDVSGAGGRCKISISNTGKAMKKLPTPGTGISNCIARLDRLYGDRHDFQMSSAEGETVVAFYLPTIPHRDAPHSHH